MHYTIGDATVGGVTFTAPSCTAVVITYGPGTFGGVPFFSGQGPLAGPSNATATLAGVTAIGFYYSPGDDAGGAIKVTLNVEFGDIFLPVPTYNTIDFVGFTSTSDTPITSVAFTEMGDGMDITQFVLGTANPATTPAPEPASMLLLGLGLIGLAEVRRKIKK